MNERIKQLWIEALRSNNYKQGKQGLRNTNNEYCCLGVLCDILIKEVPELNLKWKLSKNDKYTSFRYRINNINFVSLPYKVMKLYNITFNKINYLIYLNDCQNYNFIQIANWIEENL